MKLNEQKTEVLLCGPSSRRGTLAVDCLSVGESSIPFSNVVKTFGDILCLNRCQIFFFFFFFHIRSLSKVCSYVSCKAATSIDVCPILSKLDYCNGLLSGLPYKQMKCLQALQNAAARNAMKFKKKKRKNQKKIRKNK